MKNTRLPPELQAAWEEIESHARDYGLDFFPIIYEVLDYRTLYETAALGGFPTRYPHWRFGMEYDQLIKGHVWLGSTRWRTTPRAFSGSSSAMATISSRISSTPASRSTT